jgi:hypothetical protein
VLDGERTAAKRAKIRAELQEEYQLLVGALEKVWRLRARQVIWAIFLAVGIGVGATAGMVFQIRATARKQAEITQALRQYVERSRQMVVELERKDKLDGVRYNNLLRALESARRRLDAHAK